MPKKQKKFADDGWAVWIDGDDVSTIYINDWLNPKGKSYVDLAVRSPCNKVKNMGTFGVVNHSRDSGCGLLRNLLCFAQRTIFAKAKYRSHSRILTANKNST